MVLHAAEAPPKLRQAAAPPGVLARAFRVILPCNLAIPDVTGPARIEAEHHVQTFFLYVLALGAGVSVATQQVLNGSLRASLGSPAWAGLISYAGGLLTMIVAVIALGESTPSLKTMANVPWLAWSGGVFGGAFILLSILLLPSLGAATLFALVIAGQVLAAVTLDHFGALGLEPHPISTMRLAGAALLIAGVVLIRD
jgi:transporter family-2 protein